MSAPEMRLAVIEGKWFPDRNISVKSIFDLLSDLHCDSRHSFHYEMFNDGRAFREIMLRLAKLRGLHYIYIAAHGSDDAIYGSNEEPISKADVRKVLMEIKSTPGATLKGIYFGSCAFVNDSLVEFVSQKDNGIRWIAGYASDVEWITSSALDWCFWNYFLCAEGTGIEKIEQTAAFLQTGMEGLCELCEFNVYRKRGQNFIPLISYGDHSDEQEDEYEESEEDSEDW